MSDVNLNITEGDDIYLSITETPAVVSLSAAVVAGGLVDTVTISNFPATQVVSVSNLPAATTVTGTVALDTASLAALESITVTVGNIQIGSSVSVSNFPASQTIAGTVTANVPLLNDNGGGSSAFYVTGIDVNAIRTVLYSSATDEFGNDQGAPVDSANPLPITSLENKIDPDFLEIRKTSNILSGNNLGVNIDGIYQKTSIIRRSNLKNSSNVPVYAKIGDTDTVFTYHGSTCPGGIDQSNGWAGNDSRWGFFSSDFMWTHYYAPENYRDLNSLIDNFGGQYIYLNATGATVGIEIKPSRTPVSGTVTVSSLPSIIGTVTVGSCVTHGVTIANSVTIASLPAISGTVTASITGTVPVSGTFYQATQPVSLVSVPTHGVTLASTTVTVSSLPALAAGTAQIGSVTASITGTVPVSGTFWQATQPVSLASLPATTVTVSSLPAISGTVTVSLSTDAFNNAQGGIAGDDGGSEPSFGVQLGYFDGDYKTVKPSNPLPISGTVTASPAGASSASVTVFSETSSAEIAAANGARKVITIFNSSANPLYVLLGAGTASSSNFSFALGENEVLSLSNITCAVQGVIPAGGDAYVTELE